MGKIITRKQTKEEIKRDVDVALLETDMIMLGFHRADSSIIKFFAIDKPEAIKRVTDLLKEL